MISNKTNQDETNQKSVQRSNKNNIDDIDEYNDDGYDNYCDYIDDSFLDDSYGDNNDIYEDDNGYVSSRRPWLLRIVALVTGLVFLGLVIVTSWPAWQAPLGGVVARSLQLQKDIDIQRLQAAVVQINVVARKQNTLALVEQKSGTGFNIDSSGIIVTNHHVIKDALNMVISFPNGEIYKAVNWASKPEFDLAVITLQADKLPVVPLNIEEQPVLGDNVRVVGNPLGLNNIVAEGQMEQYLMVGDKPSRVFGISAPVYPGNSGSPVFDYNGRVVGVVFGNLHRQVDGVDKVTGLAIPIQEVLDLHK